MSVMLRPRRLTVDVTNELKALYPPTIKLAVLLVTYNHEKYILKALDSILYQDIDLDFEIVIADDASQDRTRDIIKEYLDKVGKKNYRFLDFSKNIGITKNYQRAFYACDAEYIAVLEGDDYWVNTGKLRMQLNYLHMHRECVGASTNYFVSIEERAEFYPRVEISPRWSYIDARSLIRDNLIGNFSTCMYRAKALRTLPAKLFDGESYDWIVNISLMKYGLIGFYNEPMSVYRVHLNGTWSRMSDVERVDSQLGALARFDEITGFVFKEDFQKLREHLHDFRRTLIVDPMAVRNAAVQDAIRRSRHPLATRLMHAAHRRLPAGATSFVRNLMPRGFRQNVIKIMTGH